jgi:hypothetical protein
MSLFFRKKMTNTCIWSVVQEDDPLTYEEALQSPLSKEWQGAIEDELKSLSREWYLGSCPITNWQEDFGNQMGFQN